MGKFAGRDLGKIEVPEKGDFGAALLAAGMAKEYHGGRGAVIELQFGMIRAIRLAWIVSPKVCFLLPQLESCYSMCNEGVKSVGMVCRSSKTDWMG